ncbi:hypothetical protein ACMFMG_000845 [Clarireedia jacksonii]
MSFADVSKICVDYTINGLTIMRAIANKPFRFAYVSGSVAERDQSKSLYFLKNVVLEFAKQHAPDVQVTVAKPGAIDGLDRVTSKNFMIKILYTPFKTIGLVPGLHVSELAAAMIDQCLNGITKDPLWSKELEVIGQGVLSKEDYLQ